MCGCGKTVTRVVPLLSQRTLSHANCEDINVGLLEVFSKLLTCAVTYNLATVLQVQQASLTSNDILVKQWIEEKTLHPQSCKFHDKLAQVQNIVNRIIIYGRC